MDSISNKHDPHHHVHFPPEDIARKEGKEHDKTLDTLNIHKPEHVSLSSHVFIAEEDIARKEGKEHNKTLDVLNIHKPKDVSLSTHVHFTEDDLKRKEGKEHNKALDKYNVHAPENPLKVKVSKEDFFLHLKIAFILCIMFFGGTYYSSTLPPKEKTTEKGKSALESMGEFVDLLEEALYALKPPSIPTPMIHNEHGAWLHPDCNLVLAQSSIPNSIFGVFTRKDFKEGDVIFGPSDLISLQENVQVPPNLPLLKHHSVFANVKVDEHSYAIVATGDIRAGSELFVNLAEDSLGVGYQNYYQTVLYPNDPTKEDYEEADAVIQELFDIIPLKAEKDIRKTGRRTVKRQTVMKRKMIPTVDAGSMLKIYRDHIGKYNPRLESLIPIETNEARSVLDNGSTLTFISNVRELEWLEKHSLCLDGIRAGKNNDVDGSINVFTTRSVSKGSVISSFPVIVTKDENRKDKCFKLFRDDVNLCPLASASLVRTSGRTCADEENCPINSANAFYSLSSSNKWNMDRLHDSVDGPFLNTQMTGLTVDILAMRDMVEGEEIFVNRDVVH